MGIINNIVMFSEVRSCEFFSESVANLGTSLGANTEDPKLLQQKLITIPCDSCPIEKSSIPIGEFSELKKKNLNKSKPITEKRTDVKDVNEVRDIKSIANKLNLKESNDAKSSKSINSEEMNENTSGNDDAEKEFNST